MSKLMMLKNTITSAAGRSGLLVKKFSPEILMGVGVVGIVASTVMACKATLKVDEVLKETGENAEKIKHAHETVDKDTYSDKDYKKDLVTNKVQAAVALAKLYGPSVALGVASIACVLSSHNIMRKRNLALVAAYKAVSDGFNKYRQRVVNELGVDKDRQFKYGATKMTVVEEHTDGDGTTKQVQTVVDVVNPSGVSEYARFFDESCHTWNNVPEYNLVFLKCQQNYANELLRARGHLFLNEVYDMLGIPRSKAGAVVGWVVGQGDDYVDFGIYDVAVTGYRDDNVCDTISEERRDFINGYRNHILLDFNVDGVIWDLI